jgi:hypothetical protein
MLASASTVEEFPAHFGLSIYHGHRGDFDRSTRRADRLTEPELLRIEAGWLRAAGREENARLLLLRAISTAREHGSWPLAVRSALALARSPSAAHEADLKLLGDLCARLPPENDTDYRREARALLDQGSAATQP